uniref:ABC transporter domain-containing protein n=1 Tax=Spongospora subterranea TaxID=70186 RepID=A0A0H5RCW5_9EUKA|eukprot:CRZ11601.1 hypothetical protein [Spongospora subterranea]
MPIMVSFRAITRYTHIRYHSTNPIICTLNAVSKRLSPDRVLFANGVNLTFSKGAKIGMVGPNGIGKSSLLKIIAGFDNEYDGEISRSQDMTVAYLDQEPHLDPKISVLDNIRQRLHKHFDLLDQFEQVSMKFAEPDADIEALVEQQSSLQAIIDENDLWNLDRRISVFMAALCCPPPDCIVGPLSGGEKRRVALCAMLLSAADFLLLDEPTNHMDAMSVAWLEKYLHSYKGTVLAVTHDRYFLDNVATSIFEANTASVQTHTGNYSKFLEQSVLRTSVQQRTLSGKEAQIAAELEWIRKGGRQIASKARMKQFEALVDEAKSESRVNNSLARGKLIIPHGRRLGDRVLECNNVSKSFDGRTLISNLSFTVEPGAIIGIVGANGTGKSTLLRMLVGELTPDTGSIALGSTVEVGYVLQSRAELDPTQSVFREIVPDLQPVRVGRMMMPARQYVAQFNFTGTDQEKLIGQLSGGERNRVHLAKLLRNGCNLLILDEPTNDLDVTTLRALEEGLEDFPGSAIIVSHDRWFLDRTCTHILAFESDGTVRMFAGNYSEYRALGKGRTGSIQSPESIR